MAVQTDFMIAVNQIAAERGIDPNIVMNAIKEAIATSFKRDSEEEGLSIEVEIDSEVGTIAVYADKKVVDKVTNPSTQISVDEAQQIEPKLREGDHIVVDVTPEGDFGRVAAQAAKQVILQKIREAERESQLKEFEDRIGEVESAVVQRMDGDRVIWEINKATAVMLPEDRVPTEFYKSGTRHKVLLKSIEEGPRGKVLYASRASKDFLKALFELEIPEILSGSIDIKGIAREAGSRSKVAVASNVDGIDPIGSCVGQKGVRINAIMNELKMNERDEKIDIILWDEDITEFIANALSPAQAVSVEVVDEEERLAKAIVPDEQLSLAIGKDGQNVRLAAKLTGWKIDIQGETVKVESKYELDEESDSTEALSDEQEAGEEGETKEEIVKEGGISELELSTRTENALKKAGVETVEDLKSYEDYSEIEGIGPKAVEEIEKALS